MNKRQYEKYIGKNVVSKKEPNRKDKKFYKKRIVDLTKRLLNNEKPEKMFPDVSSVFDSYANVCIEYFKVLDKADIIQSDYDECHDENTNKYNNQCNIPCNNQCNIKLSEKNQEEVNKLLMRTFKINEPNALEKLVKRTSTKISKKPPIIPMQKDINLKDPNLKNKGIRKKNNINNTYEETSENKKTSKTNKTNETNKTNKTNETNE